MVLAGSALSQRPAPLDWREKRESGCSEARISSPTFVFFSTSIVLASRVLTEIGKEDDNFGREITLFYHQIKECFSVSFRRKRPR